MRHANKEHRVLMGIGGRIVNSAPGMLLEHVVNVLHARDVPLANTIHALIKPAERPGQAPCRNSESSRHPLVSRALSTAHRR